MHMTKYPPIHASLTWNDLQDSVLLHVDWQVPCSHFVVLNFDGGQFLEITTLQLTTFPTERLKLKVLFYS